MAITQRVLLTTGIFPPDVGGPATYVERLARSLAVDGYDVVVVTLGARGEAQASNGYRVRRIPRRLPFAVRVAVTALSIARWAHRSDIVYCNGLELETLLGATGAELVSKIVGDRAWEIAWNSGRTALPIDRFQHAPVWPARVAAARYVQTRLGNTSRAVVVASRFLERIARAWGIRPGVFHVIPNSVELAELVPGRIDRVRERPLRVLTGGRLVGWKGFRELVWATAADEGLALTIVGDGPIRDELAYMIHRAGARGRVSLLPSVPPSAMRGLMEEHDVFALPSSSETFSYLVIEAMASGVPVVAARSGALPEVVEDGHTGLLCRYGDVGDIGHALRRLATDDVLYRSLARAGRAHVESTCEWRRIYKLTCELLFSHATVQAAWR